MRGDPVCHYADKSSFSFSHTGRFCVVISQATSIMKEYKEFTFGWLIFAFAIPAHILITFLYINHVGSDPMTTSSFIGANLTLVAVYLLFYGLTTTITSDAIVVSFGIGLIRKRIKLERIKHAETVHNPWYYGWGIRFIPNGMLYNISGSEGVELKFKDSTRVIRIGSKMPEVLKEEIGRRLA